MPRSLSNTANFLSGNGFNRALAPLAILIVALLILWQLFVFYSGITFSPEVQQPVTQTTNTNTQAYQVSSITSKNLFGQADPDQALSANLPTTSLQLMLRGVFTSTNPTQGSAIIESPDGTTRSFKVNSTVFGNAKLHSVFADRIVLSQSGELETLYFPTPSSTASNTNQLSVNDLPQNVQTLVRNTMTAEEISSTRQQLSSSSLTAEERQQLIRQRLQELRNRAREQRENSQ